MEGMESGRSSNRTPLKRLRKWRGAPIKSGEGACVSIKCAQGLAGESNMAAHCILEDLEKACMTVGHVHVLNQLNAWVDIVRRHTLLLEPQFPAR